MEEKSLFSIIECILFVAGDPVAIGELSRSLLMDEMAMRETLQHMQTAYAREGRGILPYMTDETVQLVSNKNYIKYVEQVLQPLQTKSFSQSMLETLSIIAYRQPVTRSDIEAVRGVRCDYSVLQLLNLGMIRELGRKDCVGRPMLFGTTDQFLRQFGLSGIQDLPDFKQYSSLELEHDEIQAQAANLE